MYYYYYYNYNNNNINNNDNTTNIHNESNNNKTRNETIIIIRIIIIDPSRKWDELFSANGLAFARSQCAGPIVGATEDDTTIMQGSRLIIFLK